MNIQKRNKWKVKSVALFSALCGIMLLNTSCSNEETFPTIERVSADRISRIELSPNSEVLNADGNSSLSFNVRCYYKVDTLEIRLPEERVPFESIQITSSDGRTFNVTEDYTTTNTTDSVLFTATYNGITSTPTSVALRANSSLELAKIRIPLLFTAFYTDRNQENLANLTRAQLDAMVARVNQVFAGTLENTPNGCDAKMEFYIQDYRQVKLTTAQDDDFDTYLEQNHMADTTGVVNVWLYNGIGASGLDYDNCHPYYIIGSESDVPGLDLEEMESFDDISDVLPNAVGIGMTFSDVYQYALKEYNNSFEYLLGRYYGLLPTQRRSSGVGDGEDVDYCDDTYTYQSAGRGIRKNTIFNPLKGRTFSYESYNIMDKPSRSTSLSVDQVKRIREVIKLCPYRQQGIEQ